MDSCTVEELSQHFEKKLSLLKNAMILSNAAADKSCIEVKNALLPLLDDVKLELWKMRREVDRAKEQLQKLEAIKTQCANLLQHLQFVVDNTPAQLPSKKCTVNQQAASNQNGTNSNANSAVQQVTRSCSYLDFITVDEFEAVPKYMKGRLKYEKVNSIIEQLDKVFSEKYQILKLKTSSLNDLNRKRVEAFRLQEKDSAGDVFIVEKDISDLASLKVDSNLRNVIMILRHCNILREVRGGGYVRFATTSRW
ncbi:hypothetical protein BsWGS_04098 [Bradybaena similaris]